MEDLNNEERDTLKEEIISDFKNMKFKKIVILIGAGISVAAGIPDFRSPQTGYFDTFTKYDVPYPEAMFEEDYFNENPGPLYKFIWEVIKLDPKPTNAHYFLKFLAEKKIISKIFTQNIDGLEEVSGIDPELIINAHGTLRIFKCPKCKTRSNIMDHLTNIDKVLSCECGAVLRPKILFYEEKLPGKFWKNQGKIVEADLVLIMGTSLKVSPFDKVINLADKDAPIIVFNKHKFDLKHPKVLNIVGDIQKTVLELLDELSWRTDYDKAKEREY